MGGIEEAKEFLMSCNDVKKELPCVIIVNGKQIQLQSGKSAWKSKGAARSALTNALYYKCKHPSLVRRELEKEGFVEFREFKI